ncbi:MAG TPA: hypothetical protein VL859_13910 [Flavobacterium sp.]|nr:hypothetical protein [Flavobacterium sp.]
MKKSVFLTYGIALAILLIACNNKRNDLVDSWKVTGVEAKKPLSDSAKNEILAKGTLTFTKDGHVNGFLESDIDKGSYALTKKGKNLVIKDQTGTPYPFECKITDDQLILDSEDMKITLVKK